MEQSGRQASRSRQASIAAECIELGEAAIGGRTERLTCAVYSLSLQTL